MRSKSRRILAFKNTGFKALQNLVQALLPYSLTARLWLCFLISQSYWIFICKMGINCYSLLPRPVVRVNWDNVGNVFSTASGSRGTEWVTAVIILMVHNYTLTKAVTHHIWGLSRMNPGIPTLMKWGNIITI